jgi:hypothetical protein
MSNPYLPHWADPAVTWGSLWLWPTAAELLAGQNPPPVPQPKTKRKTNKHTMNADYIPLSYRNLLIWLIKQDTEITPALATTIGMPVDDRTAYLAAVLGIKAKADLIVEAMETLEELTAGFPAILEQYLPIIRAEIKRDKTRPGCTLEIQTMLDWIGPVQNLDPAHARPTITIEAQRGRVLINGRKPGFDAVNIYSRKKGDVQWKLIAIRKRRFPYYDETPLAVANTPEVREYMAIGVVKDEEIGQMSEIKEVVYAG